MSRGRRRPTGGGPPPHQRDERRRDDRDARREPREDARPDHGARRQTDARREADTRGGDARDARREAGAGREDGVRRATQRRGEAEQAAADDRLYGLSPVLEALRAGARPVERITVAEGAHESRLRELLELARAQNVLVRRAPRAELQRMAGGANHQGVIAQVGAARYADADELLARLAARVGTDSPPLALVLDGVEDPRNLGAILRTAVCAGADGVFVPERRAAGLTETVAKAAAGALEYLPVARAANLARLQEGLKERGVWCVGTAADAASDYTEWDWTSPCAVFLGGEGEGLRRLLRERCDALVRIPLRGPIESLNVSVAAGVILYEAVRQRTARQARAYTSGSDMGS